MKKVDGFTLVEVLVVIAILAIMSVITITTYRGVQDRALSSSIDTAVHAYLNTVQLYKLSYGHYPTPNDVANKPSGSNGWWAICMGFAADYPLTAKFPQGSCSNGAAALNLSYQGDVMTSNNLRSMLSEFASPLPSVAALSDSKVSGYPLRGIIYTPWYPDGGSAQLEYELSGKSMTCPQGWGNAGYLADGVRCVILLQ